ncbi:MAG: dTMP kinase [Candidatus Omnitrophica bacterium]|nr:dTMP kinase [Candidatus Omnitrophota bacterium]
MSGKWIVFEGLDGAGTTTQVERFVTRLREAGVGADSILQTAEPTAGPFGQLCREALRGKFSLDPQTLALAFTVDRSHHLSKEEGILAHQDRGHWIAMDRYFYSTLAYQDEVDRDWLLSLCKLFPRPDLVVFLDTPVEVCLERIHARGKDRDVYEEESAMKRIRESYHWVREHEETRSEWLTLAGDLPAEEISDRVWERVWG